MKKGLLVCLVLLCGLGRAAGQTEVCLVGTRHEPCAYFNSDSVHVILSRVRPDVVLMELDSSFFDRNFRFDLERYPDLLSTNETIAAHRYQQEQGVDLRPFEITGRNEWYRAHRYFERQDSMWRDALALYRADRLGRKDREDMELILQVMNYNDMQFASPPGHEFQHDDGIPDAPRIHTLPKTGLHRGERAAARPLAGLCPDMVLPLV